MVMGVQQQGRGSGVIDLKAFVPAAWAGETLCMRVVSSNGLYEAANEYSVPLAWQGGVAALPYPTRYEDRLGQMVQNELGARLQLGECSSKNVEATVVSWNDGARKARSLLLNSFQAEAVFVYIEGQARPIRCDPITLEGRTAFDTSCTMQVVDTDRPTEIEILRIVDGNAAPSTKVRVWLNAL
ncbi:hypothetical protein CFI11_09640 [Thalassococcus sp. S3]|nr:hypothetical protein CFI11_09640 [Thalassococcus sp. S3]